jgi:hypothetical protein
MKANEAPEKIYLYPSDRAGEDYEDEWGTMPWGEDYVEYTRTDTFIEKAVDWITRNGSYYVGFEQGQPCVDKEFIDNFKAAMMK